MKGWLLSRVPWLLLNFDNPWELPHLEVVADIQFSESVSMYTDEEGRERYLWESNDVVKAVAYDIPIY
ncbi:4068_t:CDS:2, partial [Dentiscutata erythropus]